MARREPSRRAMSFLELIAVVAIIALLTTAAITRYGHDALGNGSAEGFARKLALSMVHARRATISTGDNHYLQLTNSGGSITDYSLIRRASGGDTQVDETRAVPADITVVSAATTLEFDFDGSALGSYWVTVVGPDRTWVVSTVMLTGTVQVAEVP